MIGGWPWLTQCDDDVWCTYTDPEIAHVGLYIREAREKSIPVETFTVLMHDVDRAVTDGEEEGFVKVHVKQGADRFLVPRWSRVTRER